MDISILFTVFSSFVLFLVLQFLVFRRIAAVHVFSAMMGVFVVAGGITHGISLFRLSVQGFSWQEIVVTGLISSLLYGLLALIYILAVFGIIESSIRIRLLREIVGAGSRGKTEKELLAVYNRDTILAKRLGRFLASGDIVYEKKHYRLVRRVSFYLFPALLFRLVWRMYK